MARVTFLALVLALVAITFATPIPQWAKPIARAAPESPSPSPSLPTGCHRIGSHVVCERPVTRAAPESPSPSPSLSAEEILAILNALPGPLKVETLPPLVTDDGAYPGEHTQITTHGDKDFVEVKPTPAVAPDYITSLPKSAWEESEKIWREEGIIVLDYRAVGSEEKEDGVGKEDGKKKKDEGNEEDEDEEDEEEEDGEGKDGKEQKVQERELGDCKPGGWGC